MTTTTKNNVRAPSRGDIVFFEYGAMCGREVGTVIGCEATSFGTLYWVRKEDFSLEPIPAPTETVTGRIRHDYEGNPYMSVRGATRIGAYLVEMIAE